MIVVTGATGHIGNVVVRELTARQQRVRAKMTIFHNPGFIDTGIEIVPVKGFADSMSTGVSYFEQFVWDLDKRGVAGIDIPVLILGVDL